MRVTGPSAEIRWGYRLVARLGPWVSDRTGAGGTLKAEGVTIIDAFGAEQRPLTLVIPTTAHTGAWVWPLRDVVFEDNGRMTCAVLGTETGAHHGAVSVRAAERDSVAAVGR